MSLGLEGSVAIVTGVAGGIGRVFAKGLAEAGATVLACDIAETGAVQVVDEIVSDGFEASHFRVDQSDPQSALAMASAALERYGKIDILVNNASLFGTLERRSATEITAEEWRRVIGVNLDGVFFCCAAVLPHMVASGRGKIVNISSSAIFQARNRLPHYVAAKAGVIGLTHALAREYGAHGITVNALSPGSTDSGAAIVPREYAEAAVASRAIPRVQLPSDLLGGLLFLCSPLSDFFTGQNLVVDGGSNFT
ncbi:MAG TPA: SDR family NAD(P)-dependent oxidoreductase [Candidatus Micrarchaeaceae archaeon]|nr:SDR family NAD(P)-dependent oxidoreductase [Candidatus Micrarchaeaceae archaeon]